jgi:hypothetical protein
MGCAQKPCVSHEHRSLGPKVGGRHSGDICHGAVDTHFYERYLEKEGHMTSFIPDQPSARYKNGGERHPSRPGVCDVGVNRVGPSHQRQRFLRNAQKAGLCTLPALTGFLRCL